MSVIFIALPAAVFLAACAVGAFVWAVRRGQYDDLDTPPMRAVFDDGEAGPGGSGLEESPGFGGAGGAGR